MEEEKKDKYLSFYGKMEVRNTIENWSPVVFDSSTSIICKERQKKTDETVMTLRKKLENYRLKIIFFLVS